MAVPQRRRASYMVARKPAIAPPSNIKVAMTPERIARGKYIFELSDCDGCHSGRDFTRFGGPVIADQRGAGRGVSEGDGTAGARSLRATSRWIARRASAHWTDGEKIRAIREGISRDGKTLFPMMPYTRFRKMSDEDVYSLVAFLNTLPPVKHNVAAERGGFSGFGADEGAQRSPRGSVAEPNHADLPESRGISCEPGGMRGLSHAESKRANPSRA